jgi:membrane associated rhomboid family serine protease
MGRITEVVKNLLIINILVFFSARYLLERFGVEDYLWLRGKNLEGSNLYQLFTYQFMHSDERHLLFNMMGLYLMGPMVESVLGQRRFLFLYITAGLCGGAAQYFLHANGISAGASACLYGVTTAFALMFPDAKMMIFPLPFEVKAIYLALFYLSYSLFAGKLGITEDIGHFAHFAGGIAGAILIYRWGLSAFK